MLAKNPPAGNLTFRSEKARADNQVSIAFEDRPNHLRDFTTIMLAVAIDCNNDIYAFQLAYMLEAGLERHPFARIDFMTDNERTGGFGYFGRIIPRTVINDDDRRGIATGLDDHAADKTGFVIGGDNDCRLVKTGRESLVG